MPEPEAWDRLSARPGLCRGCVHARLLTSARSAFVRCDRADLDPTFRRYPVLPVLECAGFAAGESPGGSLRGSS